VRLEWSRRSSRSENSDWGRLRNLVFRAKMAKKILRIADFFVDSVIGALKKGPSGGRGGEKKTCISCYPLG